MLTQKELSLTGAGFMGSTLYGSLVATQPKFACSAIWRATLSSKTVHDVPDFASMTGVPKRRTGWMSKAGERLGANLICPRDGGRYREVSGGRLDQIP